MSTVAARSWRHYRRAHSINGRILDTQLFVAVLGATNHTFAEATWTQGLGDWNRQQAAASEIVVFGAK